MALFQGTKGGSLLVIDIAISVRKLERHNSPLIGLLHPDGHVGHLVHALGDEAHHVLAGERGGLVGLGQLALVLQELAQVGVGAQRGVRGCARKETFQGRAPTLNKLRNCE